MRPPSGLSFCVVLAGIALSIAVPVAADGSPGRIRFTYDLGHTVTGHVEGSCEASIVMLPEDAPHVVPGESAAAGAILTRHWWNYTRSAVAGQEVARVGAASGIQTQTLRLPNGPFTLSLPSEGRALVVAPQAEAGAPWPQLSFEAEALQTGAAVRGDRVVGVEPDAGGAIPGSRAGNELRTTEWGRRVQFQNADVRVSGTLALVLPGGVLEAGGERYELPPAFEVHRTPVAPGVENVTEVRTATTVVMAGAHLSRLPSQTTAICRAMHLDVDGRLTAYEARGSAEVHDRSFQFANQELTLLGRFAVDEAPESLSDGGVARTSVAAEGRGEFQAVGLDFRATAGSFELPDMASLTLGTAAAAGAGALVWKLWPTLFTRVTHETALRDARRQRLHEAIRAQPGLGLVDLAGRTGMNESTARYHLRRLERSGHVRSFRHRGAWRYVAATEDVRRVHQSFTLAGDPWVRQLVSRLGPQGLPRGALLKTLVSEWGLSRTGVRKVIDRAVAARLVIQESSGREATLRTQP